MKSQSQFQDNNVHKHILLNWSYSIAQLRWESTGSFCGTVGHQSTVMSSKLSDTALTLTIGSGGPVNRNTLSEVVKDQNMHDS